MPGRRGRLTAQQSTHPLVWLAAIVCTILAITVIGAGLAMLVGYLILQPKIPYIRTTYAHLDTLNYDSRYGNLDTQITLHITAVNKNKVHARFSDIKFLLRLDGVPIAQLRADPFDVAKNGTLTLPYVVQYSSPIPLGTRVMEELDESLKQYKVSFNLKGDARTRWKVGIIGFVKFWTHLTCQLVFFTNGSSINSDCSSKSAK